MTVVFLFSLFGFVFVSAAKQNAVAIRNLLRALRLCHLLLCRECLIDPRVMQSIWVSECVVSAPIQMECRCLCGYRSRRHEFDDVDEHDFSSTLLSFRGGLELPTR